MPKHRSQTSFIALSCLAAGTCLLAPACGDDGAPTGGAGGSAASAGTVGTGATDGTGAAGATAGSGGSSPDPDAGDGTIRDALPDGDAAEDADLRDNESDGAPPGCNGPGSRFATGVREHSFGPDQNFGQDLFPTPLLGPPRGAGCCAGSFDVVSLGNGGFVVLEFEGNTIVDGPGPDFIVFENAFYISGNEQNPNAELGTVAVSHDGQNWTEFPCTETAFPYGSCSGWHPTYANADTNQIDPTDPAAAGGEAFDLADVSVVRARYVRITDREDIVGSVGVYDLDAVAIVNAACP